MSSTLEDLFVQILQSEQKAQERKSLLNEGEDYRVHRACIVLKYDSLKYQCW